MGDTDTKGKKMCMCGHNCHCDTKECKKCMCIECNCNPVWGDNTVDME